MLVMQREGGERSPCSSCAFVHASFMSVPRSEAVVGCFPAHNTRIAPLCVTLARCLYRAELQWLHTLVQEKDAVIDPALPQIRELTAALATKDAAEVQALRAQLAARGRYADFEEATKEEGQAH